MHAHRHRTTTPLGLTAVVFLVIGAVSTIGRLPAVSELYAQTSWRGLIVAPEQRCSPYDADDPVPHDHLDGQVVAFASPKARTRRRRPADEIL